MARERVAQQVGQGTVILAPGITATPGVYGGEPVISGSRIPPEAVYDFWLAGTAWPEIAEHYPDLGQDEWFVALAWAAGRRYEREQARRDKRRRWVGSINDADAHRAAGRAEGLAAAADYLRASGRGDWAVVLTATLKERKEGA